MREREALDIILPRDPPSFFDEVSIHSAGKRDWAAEAERTETEEIGE